MSVNREDLEYEDRRFDIKNPRGPVRVHGRDSGSHAGFSAGLSSVRFGGRLFAHVPASGGRGRPEGHGLSVGRSGFGRAFPVPGPVRNAGMARGGRDRGGNDLFGRCAVPGARFTCGILSRLSRDAGRRALSVFCRSRGDPVPAGQDRPDGGGLVCHPGGLEGASDLSPDGFRVIRDLTVCGSECGTE